MSAQALIENYAYAVSPYEELLDYEYLYAQQGASLKKISRETVGSGKLPSEVFDEKYGLVQPDDYVNVEKCIDDKIGKFSVVINSTQSWPKKLRDSSNPVPVVYYRGDISLLETKSVSVVGARKASHEGLARARRITSELSAEGITVVTGLARGVDTAVAKSAIDKDGHVIGVIGTPIDEYYPKENRELQDNVAKNQLLISQVPFYRYKKQPFESKRLYFPERNELMAAVSDATIIVEASDTSGTLSQARACLKQGRPLFIMESCVNNRNVKWPEKYLGKDNVYVLSDVNQVFDVINQAG